ncbi:uncharacterized protein [Spinacia oleracea]|uniref:Uncharacterized protein n=1 Tax=Spinacia oleracea TaxID=3562 RepID=A0A9R0HRD3_SPIOL|nr:uncharacterized protein LOC110775286 [Spinacia oleracea]
MASHFSVDETKQCFTAAAFAGNLRYLKILRKKLDDGTGIGKDLEEICDDSFGRNALHAAASRGKLDVCKYLVEELQFDVNKQDANGDTPLHISTLEEDYETSAYLLDHGADSNIAMDKGFTPLHYAAQKGRANLLRLLISKGAKVDAQSPLGTPLQAAAVHGMTDAVMFLLDNNANPNLVCPNTLPPLMSAIYAKSKLCVKSLIEWGADPNVISRGLTPLIVAASEGQTDIIKCLLLLGADPDIPNFYDLTPIQIAAQLRNHADVMALLPVTTPIPSIPDWSVRGIIEYVNSAEAKKEGKLKHEKKFLEAKAKGAEAVKREHFLDAAYWYSEAISLRPTDAAVLSNRSFCWARLKEGDRSLHDALACIELRNDWPKAHYRAGVAWGLLRDYESAKKEFEIALKLDPENTDLLDSYREAVLDVHAVEMYKKKQELPSRYDEDPQDELYEEYINSIL